ncbi:5-carboxymethyl-2-hydroxymuconate isomerase [Anianabacter salinae]|uniref:5-carboxymethyl-2-hydroxymuconate isomerase n=1 Tax=Anianabacter salinae TaxID=2851023 RepID=UPI00225E68EA|nr:5-carboxymethyl-2-hydroxymuconate isomerase [Anianabacter salinae]MBV0911780.1 5-carboxymethyl-2-hydroxymuconate Delta-isomerase [Anianabacter salinae]
MPHLSFEYSTGLGEIADLDGFARHMRDAMLDTGVFPLGGIRVRGFEADVMAVADGNGHHFLDMVLRMGQGRDPEVREGAADTLYAAARTYLEPQVTGTFMLSLELVEIDARFSRKGWNTVHAAVAT